MGELKITLKRSTIGVIPKHRKTLEALGLRKIRQTVIKKDDPAIRGMVRQISYMVNVEEA